MMIRIDVFPSASILLDRSSSSWKINPDWSGGLWFRSPCNELIVWYVCQFLTVFPETSSLCVDRKVLAVVIRLLRWLAGSQPVLIFHPIPASAASCTGFTRNRPEGMHARFSTDTASHPVSQPAVSHPPLSCPGMARLRLPLHPKRMIRWILYAHHAQGWTNAYCSALASVLLFIFIASPTWTRIQM